MEGIVFGVVPLICLAGSIFIFAGIAQDSISGGVLEGIVVGLTTFIVCTLLIDLSFLSVSRVASRDFYDSYVTELPGLVEASQAEDVSPESRLYANKRIVNLESDKVYYQEARQGVLKGWVDERIDTLDSRESVQEVEDASSV